jgi:hypothetical protein
MRCRRLTCCHDESQSIPLGCMGSRVFLDPAERPVATSKRLSIGCVSPSRDCGRWLETRIIGPSGGTHAGPSPMPTATNPSCSARCQRIRCFWSSKIPGVSFCCYLAICRTRAMSQVDVDDGVLCGVQGPERQGWRNPASSGGRKELGRTTQPRLLRPPCPFFPLCIIFVESVRPSSE